MKELNKVEVEEVSGGNPYAVAVICTAIIIYMYF